MKNSSRRKFKIHPKITISRNVQSGTHRFKDIFSAFEEVESVRRVFGKNVSSELDKLTVEVFPREGFMGVSDHDGHMIASQSYLNEGEDWCVYLDVVHELVHVRQFSEGKELFDRRYAYVDRPTEIEAYVAAAEEARRIGLTDEEIFAYLEVPWITREEHLRLAKTCGIILDPKTQETNS
ncbi:MAG: hypothetical protein ACREBS_03560 [Nitrososphaerales archaeon]